MSFCSWHEYGYGVKTTDVTTESIDRLQELLKLAPTLDRHIHDLFREKGIEHPTWDDYMNYDADCIGGLATILAEFLMEVEDVSFTACSDYDGDLYLIYTPSYPWEMRDNERALTTDQIDEMLRKYISILTDEEIDIDYWSVENGG